MELSYEELFEKYNLLLEENRKLKKEIAELRTRPNFYESKITSKKETFDFAINKFGSPQDKIRLFRSLFKGRDDVFARRWHSKTLGKSGYRPVCKNEWAETLCDKKKYKCGDCPNRNLSPLTDRDIYSHLAGKDPYGRDVIGIYPMLKDETCLFLCADFDEESFKTDVTAFRKICKKSNIPVSVEVSRSGKGAHAWIFFSEPLSAATARKLGSGLLTKAMEESKLSFKSYDRFFPNQDNLPRGGFGNLVALPLQGMAKKSGNSLFVDENFEPYSDQWAYLSSVKKASPKEVDEAVGVLCKSGELGKLVSEDGNKPWETMTGKALSDKDFPTKTEIIRSNMLYIPSKGLSAKAVNELKRLAAFKNPEFYRAQAMRLPIYNKPRIICTADIFEDYIALPRGCEEPLCELLDGNKIKYTLTDKANPGSKIPVSFNGILRDEQQPAAQALLRHNIGVLSATTAFGKTVIASYLIGEKKINTLILVHTQSLMTQWQEALTKFLDIDIPEPELSKSRGRKRIWSPIGILGGGKSTLKNTVDIAVMQSLISENQVRELVRNYGMIIVDECHHLSAVNFEKILKFANAKYVYGLTTTPTRQDGHQPIIFMQCGPIRYSVDAKAQALKRDFEHYLIPRFTSYYNSEEESTISDLYKALSENDLRNSFIADDVVKSLKHGRTPIILTERREHVTLLSKILSLHCENIITLFGTPSQKSRREALEKLKSISENESLIIIATGKYVGEGFDYPRLDTLFLALPIAWKGKVAQYAGRLHRDYPGKNEVQIYDYVDIRVPVLERMYRKRLKGYSSIGYKIGSNDDGKAEPDLIYDGRNYYPIFLNDLKSAEKSILLVCPFTRKNKILQLSKIFLSAAENGAKITVITRPPEDFKEAERANADENTALLKKYGVNVIFKSGIQQKFTLIDGKIVWYGSVNFLAFGAYDESVMRLKSFEIAEKLEGAV